MCLLASDSARSAPASMLGLIAMLHSAAFMSPRCVLLPQIRKEKRKREGRKKESLLDSHFCLPGCACVRLKFGTT